MPRKEIPMRGRWLFFVLLTLACAGCELLTRVDPSMIDTGMSTDDGGETIDGSMP